MNKVFVIIGPEGSGSKLCARIIAHSLHIADFYKWEGFLWAPNSTNKPVFVNKIGVLHRSIPSGKEKFVIDISDFFKKDLDPVFIYTTRDNNISAKSRNYSKSEREHWKEINKKIYKQIQSHKNILFSYESLMLLQEEYLYNIYKKLNIKSTFVPSNLLDANRKYVSNG
jgi:hypothetical protein